MCDEDYNERKAMIYLASRWIEVAATTGQAEAAIVGMLNEIHKVESQKMLHAPRKSVGYRWSPERKQARKDLLARKRKTYV